MYLKESSMMNLSDCTFLNNRAKVAGGALLLSRQVSVSFLRCNLTGNKGPNGAMIYSFDNIKFHFESSTLNRHVAKKGNLIFARNNVLFSMINSNFTNNTAGDTTPAILIAEGKSSISRCNFVANTGGVFYFSNHSRSTITKCNFSSNTGMAGAVIAPLNAEELLLLSSSFDENKAN